MYWSHQIRGIDTASFDQIVELKYFEMKRALRDSDNANDSIRSSISFVRRFEIVDKPQGTLARRLRSSRILSPISR
jgi:hypothetical protein